MKFFKASFVTIILRYYLMMFVVVGSYVINMEYLALLALPIFISAMMGITIEPIAIREYITNKIKSRRNIENSVAIA